MTFTPAVLRDRQTPVDSRFLKTLVGYNTRRATLHILGVFEQRMGALDLKPVEFSILALIGANPGVTHSELCTELNLLAPNLTKLLARLRKRNLLERTVLAQDRRAAGLSLNAEGHNLLATAQATVVELEQEATAGLTDKQRDTLMSLLQKIYL